MFNPPDASFTPRNRKQSKYENQSIEQIRVHAGGNHDRRSHHWSIGCHRDSQFREGPHYVTANACINNLRQYDGAVQQWALENKKQSSDTYGMTSIQPYVKLDSTGNLPACPAGGTYATGGAVTNPPTCSLSNIATPHKLP